jgi:hypothetical protein
MSRFPPIVTTYTLTKNPGIVVRDIDGVYIPDDPNNLDWQEYQRWLAIPNTPNPAPPTGIVFKVKNERTFQSTITKTS